MIAEQAAQLTVFQRTADLHGARRATGRSTPTRRRAIKADYADFRDANRLMPAAIGGSPADRTSSSVLEADPRTSAASSRRAGTRAASASSRAYPDLLINPEANELAAEFVREQDPRDRATIPPWPSALCPTGHRVQAPVHRQRLLRDLQPPERAARRPAARRRSRRSRRAGIRTARRRRTSSTCIVFATGFDAMTGALAARSTSAAATAAAAREVGGGPAHLPRARDGRLPEPVHRSPGPGSPSVLTNMVVSIEQHVDWIADCIDYLRAHGRRTHRGHARRPGRVGRARERRSPT